MPRIDLLKTTLGTGGFRKRRQSTQHCSRYRAARHNKSPWGIDKDGRYRPGEIVNACGGDCQSLANTLLSHAAAGLLKSSLHFKVEDDFGNLVYKYKHFKDQIFRKS